ncbi:MAG TPA: hypothetical protein VF647_04180 [Longimicrobium sp.]|jgi:hypothetical protein
MLMIDPPVTRYSPVQRIQEWVAELEERLSDPKYDEDDRRAIRRNLERARSWIPSAGPEPRS